MGHSETAVSNITSLMNQQDRSYAWLARNAGVPYKRLLAEVKHRTRPLALDTSIECAKALGADLPSLLAA
ncbi:MULTISPECIES: hypothetical protein [Actinomycetes]|uniref:hypothetical protein n=1 Tax=Actinomycetes TaxID=1760 RepID=UPI001C280EC2|nr:hypothetical protein [Streptomyces sp. AC495_CC817]